MNIRDEIITGSFMIGPDGQKEPISWKDYALELEAKIAASLPQSSTEEEEDKLWDELIEDVDDGCLQSQLQSKFKISKR